MLSATERRAGEGARIVLTAPLTETIDHAGYFIQMSMASLPIWLEGIINKKYPSWRNLEYAEDGTARYMPAGVRVLEATLRQHYGDDFRFTLENQREGGAVCALTLPIRRGVAEIPAEPRVEPKDDDEHRHERQR